VELVAAQVGAGAEACRRRRRADLHRCGDRRRDRRAAEFLSHMGALVRVGPRRGALCRRAGERHARTARR